MPIVRAKCTSCGADLTVDSQKDAAICQYCGSAFIVEKAINSFHSENHINAQTVNIYGNLESDFDIKGGVLIRYNGNSLRPVIPNTVLKISRSAFNGSMITTVSIPDSVIEIDNAFTLCPYLEELILPDSVKVFTSPRSSLTEINYINSKTGIPDGNQAMPYSNLRKIRLSDNIQELDEFVFRNCRKIEKIKIPNKLKIIPHHAFEFCTSLHEVIIPEGVEFIGRNAFAGCSSLTQISLPSTLRGIDDRAFDSCGLYSISIPKKAYLSYTTFNNCENLTSVVYDKAFSKESDILAFLNTPLYAKMITDFRKKNNLCMNCGASETTWLGRCAKCGKPR